MNVEEHKALNEAVARLDGRHCTVDVDGSRRWILDSVSYSVTYVQPDYLGDPRLWVPLLERLLRAGWLVKWRPLTERYWLEPSGIDSGFCGGGDTIAEAVCRLFSAMEGKV